MKTPELEKENELLIKAKAFLETEKPLREMEMTPKTKAHPRLHVPERKAHALRPQHRRVHPTRQRPGSSGRKIQPDRSEHAPNAGASAICGKVEAELAEMTDEDAAEFLGSYGLTDSGLARLIRKSYHLLGLISFFTAGEDECRAWTIPLNTRAQNGAGAIHSDLEKHFIRAETIRWISCWKRARKRMQERRERCVWRVKTTSCRMGMSCIYGTADNQYPVPSTKYQVPSETIWRSISKISSHGRKPWTWSPKSTS